MAKTGYIFLAKNYLTKDEDTAWMKDFGCESIVEEQAAQEKLRPEWRRMLSKIRKGDTIVVAKFSNALRGIRELGAFLDLCRQYEARVISIHDGIDSDGLLFPSSTKDVLNVVATISTEVNNLRRIEGRVRRVTKNLKPKTLKSGLKLDRERTIVNMYNSGHSIDKIWKVSGYKSRTSVFRVLNRHGVQLNRGRHQGPLKKRSERNSQ